MKERTLQINECFLSIQGESTHAGRVCSFVRLMGCPLRCTYCDTEYAFTEGKTQSFEQIFETLKGFDCRLIEITGGEPLAQKNVIPFMEELVSQGYEVLLETSGAFPIFQVPRQVAIIMDVKTPDSGEVAKMCWDNMSALKAGLDEVKFVIGSKTDFDFMMGVCRQYHLLSRVTVLASPSFGKVEARELAQWILSLPSMERDQIRLQLQMHKTIWGHEARGV